MEHIPVMVQEVVQWLALQAGDTVIDATAGTGGHTIELARQVGKNGTVVAIERDQQEIDVLCQRIAEQNLCRNVVVAGGNYADMDVICQEEKIENVAGVLFDLGFSSWHIEQSERGFSFLKNEPLDMRYEQEGVSAYDIVNTYSREELQRIFWEYGEEPKAQLIAQAIIQERKQGDIKTTGDLVQIIARIAKSRPGMNPATRSFQALRIEVNDEMHYIKKGLQSALTLVKHEGRIVVISFHSLEDRIVKNTFKEWEQSNKVRFLQKSNCSAFFRKTAQQKSAQRKITSIEHTHMKVTFNQAYIRTPLNKGVGILRKQHYIPINHFTALLTFLLFCFIIMIVGFVWTTTSLQEHDYTISSLRKQIQTAQQDEKKIQIELSEGRNIPRLLEKSSNFHFSNIERVSYVERPNVSPFSFLDE